MACPVTLALYAIDFRRNGVDDPEVKAGLAALTVHCYFSNSKIPIDIHTDTFMNA